MIADEATLAHLMRKSQRGDKHAYAVLLDECSSWLLRYYRGRVPPQQLDDLVQDVFLRVIKSAHTFDPQRASFRTWLLRIARNHCIDLGRRRGLIRFVPLLGEAEPHDEPGAAAAGVEIAVVETSAEQPLMHASLVQAVRDCIQRLDSADERQAVLLYYLGGKVYRQIGEVLGESTSMARNRVKAGQEKVRRCLEDKGINGVPAR